MGGTSSSVGTGLHQPGGEETGSSDRRLPPNRCVPRNPHHLQTNSRIPGRRDGHRTDDRGWVTLTQKSVARPQVCGCAGKRGSGKIWEVKNNPVLNARPGSAFPVTATVPRLHASSQRAPRVSLRFLAAPPPRKNYQTPATQRRLAPPAPPPRLPGRPRRARALASPSPSAFPADEVTRGSPRRGWSRSVWAVLRAEEQLCKNSTFLLNGSALRGSASLPRQKDVFDAHATVALDTRRASQGTLCQTRHPGHPCND